MSAYIVQDNQVILIAAQYQQITRGNLDLTSIEETANVLLSENYKSVNYRYNEENSETVDKTLVSHDNICNLMNKYSPIQIIKFCHNLDYQSSEHDDWKSSRAREITLDVVDSNTMKLDGYEDAKWSMGNE